MKTIVISLFAILIATAASAQVSESTKTTLAAMINLSGQLCAKVTSVTTTNQADVYNVQCIRYRDGTGTATYEVNARTGAVK